MTASFISAIEHAGFRASEPRTWALARSDGSTVQCALRLGAKSRVEGLAWWVDLHTHEAQGGAYRSANGLALEAPVEVLMRRRRGVDRLGVKLGLNRNLHLDDPAFDEGVYIESDGDLTAVRQLMSEPELRAATLSLIRDDHMAKVVVDGVRGRIQATRTWNLGQLDASDVNRLVNRLCRMRRNMPRLARSRRPVREGPNAYQKVGLGLIPVAFFGFLAIGSVSADVLVRVARSPTSLAVAAGGTSALLAVLRNLVSGSTAGFRYFLLMGIPGIAAWLLWAWAILTWLQ